MKPGFVDDVSEVLETFISEDGRRGPILLSEIVVMIWMAPSSKNMLMAASETVSSASPQSLAACRKV